jgi:hypothetical protein
MEQNTTIIWLIEHDNFVSYTLLSMYSLGLQLYLSILIVEETLFLQLLHQYS